MDSRQTIDLMKRAGEDTFDYARKAMELNGECRTEVWLFGGGQTEIIPVWRLGRGPDAVEVVRRALIARAHVVIHVGEAWYARAGKEETEAVARGEREMVRPSEREDRRECISVVVAAIGGEMVCGHMQILRKEGGKLSGFGPVEWAGDDVIESTVRVFEPLREVWRRGIAAGMIRKVN